MGEGRATMSSSPPIDFDNLPRPMTLAEFEAESAAYFALPPFASKLGGAFVHEFAGKTKSRDHLIKGAMLARTFGLVIGSPGCGKSFLMLDFAMTAAIAAAKKEAGAEWFGRRVKPCGVVYVSAEGQDDFTFRIDAWLQHAGLEREKMPFYLIPTAIDLCSNDAGTKTLINEIQQVGKRCVEDFGVEFGIVIIDTVNRALGGQDENSSQTMGNFVKNCGQIKDACSIAVMGVHHTPEGGTRARGHGALHGATDTEIFATPSFEGSPNKWKVTRYKAGATGSWNEFRLRQHVLGFDEDGDKITSCIVERLGGESSMEEAAIRDAAEEARTGQRQMTPDGRVILKLPQLGAFNALCEALRDAGEFPPLGLPAPSGRRVVKEQAFLDAIVAKAPLREGESRNVGEKDAYAKFRKRCSDVKSKAIQVFEHKNLIGFRDGWLWRTERRVYGSDEDKTEWRAAVSENIRRKSESDRRASEIDDEPAF